MVFRLVNLNVMSFPALTFNFRGKQKAALVQIFAELTVSLVYVRGACFLVPWCNFQQIFNLHCTWVLPSAPSITTTHKKTDSSSAKSECTWKKQLVSSVQVFVDLFVAKLRAGQILTRWSYLCIILSCQSEFCMYLCNEYF